MTLKKKRIVLEQVIYQNFIVIKEIQKDIIFIEPKFYCQMKENKNHCS